MSNFMLVSFQIRVQTYGNGSDKVISAGAAWSYTICLAGAILKCIKLCFLPYVSREKAGAASFAFPQRKLH
jgi:hypothetical protein